MSLLEQLPLLPYQERLDLADKIIESKTESYQGVTLAMLAPYLTRRDLDIYLKRSKFSNKEALPFLSQAELIRLTRTSLKEETKEWPDYLPFIRKRYLPELMEYAHKKKAPIDLFFPFMQKEMLRAWIEKLSKSEEKELFQKLLPFLTKSDVEESFFAQLESGKINRYLLPYLSKEAIREAYARCENDERLNPKHLKPFLVDEKEPA